MKSVVKCESRQPVLTVIKGSIIFLCFIFSLISCTLHEDRLKVDVSGIEVPPVRVHRYDRALFTIPPGELKNGLKAIQPEFPFFLGTDLDDPSKLADMEAYLANPRNIEFNKAVQSKFPELTRYDDGLTEAFRHARYHFPEVTLPRFYTYISGGDYDYPVRFADSVMIIALDCYLGNDFKPYFSDGLALYKTQRMTPEQIVPDCMRSLVNVMVPPGMQSLTFLDQVVETGKRLYLLDAFLPSTPEKIKIRYTDEQYDWIMQNESHVWSAIVENQMLYSSDGQNLRTFLADGPFTAAFGKDSPPRLGEWIGWKIVKAYMDNNPDISMKQMIMERDAQAMLTKSGYKPEKK